MNLASIIDEHAPDATALIFNNRATTYGELRDQVDRCRGGLRALGVGPDDRVALVCSNGVHFVVVYLAALGLGAVTVPLNPTSPAPELETEIAVVGAKVVVVERSSAATWAGVDRAKVPSVEHVITTDPASAHPAGANTAAASGFVPYDQLLVERPGRSDRRRSRSPGGADLHQRHGRRTSGGDADPRQPVVEHRAGAQRDGAHPRRRRDLRRVAAVPHLRPQRRVREWVCASARRWCSCSGSTRRRPCSRSRTVASR